MFMALEERRSGRGGSILWPLLMALGLAGVGGGCERSDRRAGAAAAPMRTPAAAAIAPAPPQPPPPSPATCGERGLPECPLQHWMDRQLGGPLSRDDFRGLAAALRTLAAAAPEGYGGWRPWAEGGAAAADRHDGEAVRAACTGCHDGYRPRYRAALRERPLSALDTP